MKAGRSYHEILGFSSGWLELGVVTEEQVQQLGQEYERGEDPNSEHYRYRAFYQYLSSSRPLSADQIEALYELGRCDPDSGMGGAMMHDVVSLPECPEAVREQALASGARHLVKLVTRLRLLKDLHAGLAAGLTDALFERILTTGCGPVQRGLVERAELSPERLEALAAGGANRAIRNMAAVRLRDGLRRLGKRT